MAKVPVGVKIVSILHAFLALLSILLAAGLMFGLSVASELLTSLGEFQSLGEMIILGGAILFLVIAIIQIIITIGLWKLKYWARILTIIFTSISALLSLVIAIGSPIGGAAGFILYGGIAGYLLFSHEVRQAFNG